MIKFENVGKKFGMRVVLDKLFFEIKPGEFVFLVGPSGCGKTTVFKLINKEYFPSSGEISFNQKNISKISSGKIWEYRRKFGIVFQDMKLLSDRNVFENIAIALLIRGKNEEQIKTKVKEIIGLVGLTGKEHLFPRELSGGEVQRVTIARAVVGNPDVVLADEPTADLDPSTGWEIIQLLKMINDGGKTVIIATHNFEIVNAMKKRVIFLDEGKIKSDTVGERIKI